MKRSCCYARPCWLVDVFVVGDDPFDPERIGCRETVQLTPEISTDVYVDTAEHTVLRKLEWCRRGDHVSERQWRDVLVILRAQGNRLDRGRLTLWARKLNVSDLLGRAFTEAVGTTES